MSEHAWPARPVAWIPFPRPTVRLRLTLVYAGLFLVSGACMLAFTYLIVAQLIGSYGLSVSAVSQGTRIGVHVPGILHTLEAQQADAEKRQLLTVSGIALLIMVAVSAGLGWLVAGRVLRPLRTITMAAQHISAHNLEQRLDMAGPDDELKELGDTFDELLGRLQRSFAGQRQFIANVSHELRTPLARQRVLSQVALTDPGATVDSLRVAHERVLASGTQQEQLIEALLTLALSQQGPEHRDLFDLGVVTSEVLMARQREADKARLSVDARLSPATVLGSSGLAERLVANLVDNAIRHNVPGGWITVMTDTADQHAVVIVANSGPEIAQAEVHRLLQPFQRLVPGRDGQGGNGLGLGLSIVEAIAAAHGATLIAQPQPGGGLSVQVRFPAAALDGYRSPRTGRPVSQ
jgi:signal transduction histidine kinase